MDVLSFLADTLDLILFAVLLGVGYFWGRRNESRHLADLARRERASRGVLVFATRYPPPTNVPLDPILVSGGVVVAGDYFKMFVAGLRKLVGGRFSAYETLVSRGRREALLRLKDEARAAGCRSVFNVRYVTTRIQNGPRGGPAAFEVLAYGTAFAAAPGAVADSPFHWRVDTSRTEDRPGFDLARNKATRLGLILCGIGLLYMGVEYFGGQDYAYFGDHPTDALAAGGALAALGLAMVCRRHGVPLTETLGLASLAGILAFGSAHFLALRVNALTDPAPPAATVYVLRGNGHPVGHLVPRSPGPPELDLPDIPEYWAAAGAGSEHEIWLRRGTLGFWQYDRARILERVRAYYRVHPDTT